MYLIRLVTSRDHMFEGLHRFLGGSPARYVATLTNLVTINIVTVDG